jgi:hypothetical protein
MSDPDELDDLDGLVHDPELDLGDFLFGDPDPYPFTGDPDDGNEEQDGLQLTVYEEGAFDGDSPCECPACSGESEGVQPTGSPSRCLRLSPPL